MCDVDVLDFTAFGLGLGVLCLHIYNDHYHLCTSNTTYHREKILYRAICLSVVLVISQMLAQHLAASTAQEGLL